MKTTRIVFTSFFIFVYACCFSQTPTSEMVKTETKDNLITGTTTGMYGGSDSKEALDYYDQASKFVNKQDFKNAKKYYRKAIKKDPKFVEAYDNLGVVYRKLGDLDEAIKCYKTSIELYPDGAMAHQNLALIYGLRNSISKTSFSAVITIVEHK